MQRRGGWEVTSLDSTVFKKAVGRSGIAWEKTKTRSRNPGDNALGKRSKGVMGDGWGKGFSFTGPRNER